jgi:hypothetical protein
MSYQSMPASDVVNLKIRPKWKRIFLLPIFFVRSYLIARRYDGVARSLRIAWMFTQLSSRL